MRNLDSISQELDRLYQFEISEYISRCDELKKSGLRIFRNESGQHKVVVGSGQQSRRKEEEYSYDRHGRVNKENKKDNFFVRTKKRIVRFVENVKSAIRIIKVLSNSQRYQ